MCQNSVMMLQCLLEHVYVCVCAQVSVYVPLLSAYIVVFTLCKSSLQIANSRLLVKQFKVQTHLLAVYTCIGKGLEFTG